MKYIRLTGNYVTLVDDEDYNRLWQYHWYNHGGYAVRWASGKLSYMHREILEFHEGKQNLTCDHVNRFSLDNQRSNLRYATQQQNCWNSSKHASRAYKGVYRNGSNWHAAIVFNRRKINIGTFKEQRWAAMAYDIWATTLFGEYANANFTRPLQALHLE